MNHHVSTDSRLTVSDIAKGGLVAALYVVLTLLVAPVAYGPIQFRISEMLNFLGLYNRRYVYAITLGCFLANIPNGYVDMVVGSLSTFVFLWVGRWVSQWLLQSLKAKQGLTFDPMLLAYAVMIIAFMLQMAPITIMIQYLTQALEPFWSTFWPLFISLALNEGLAMLLGSLIIYPISRRINFYD